MPPRADAEHRAAAPKSIRCFVLTVSDTRTEDSDTSGRAIAGALAAAGHVVVGRTIVKDEPARVRAVVTEQLANPEVQATVKGQKGNYTAVPVTGAEHDRIATEHALPLPFRILTGFPPRYFVRLDPR